MKKLKLLTSGVLIFASLQASAGPLSPLPSLAGLTAITDGLTPITIGLVPIINGLGPVVGGLTAITSVLTPVTALTGQILVPVLNGLNQLPTGGAQGLPALPGLPSD